VAGVRRAFGENFTCEDGCVRRGMRGGESFRDAMTLTQGFSVPLSVGMMRFFDHSRWGDLGGGVGVNTKDWGLSNQKLCGTPLLVDQMMHSIHNSIRFCSFLIFWIDQVWLTGRYPAWLALEQLYEYMVRNGKC